MSGVVGGLWLLGTSFFLVVPAGVLPVVRWRGAPLLGEPREDGAGPRWLRDPCRRLPLGRPAGAASSMARTRVLLVSADTVGPSMAGPGIRYWELARQLAGEAEVVLAVPNVPTMPATGFRVVRYRPWSLFGLVRAADVVICQGFRVPLAVLQLSGRIVVIDLYDPVPLELVEHYRDATRRDAFLGQELAALRLGRLCRLADVFLVTGERQRDFWLGALAVSGRLNWDTAGADPLLRRLVLEVPFGLPAEPLRGTGRAFRSRWPALRDGDRILLGAARGTGSILTVMRSGRWRRGETM